MGNRRDFIKTSAGVGAGAALGVFPRSLRGAPAVIIRRVTPTCVASANGLGAVSRAIEELANGTDTIEAIVRGVNLVEEDPTLSVRRDPDTAQTLLSGLGESHVELGAGKLQRKFKVEVDLVDQRIPYRETVTSTSQAEYLHKKQTGGHGQYARVALRVEPRGRGEGVEFDSEVVGGSIPRNFIPAVEKGVTEQLPEGVVAHYPMTDVKVVVYDGKHHDVDSSEMAFRLAASQALREAAQTARPILLEPIMIMRVTVPETATGDVIGDLNTRRARVQGMEQSEDMDGSAVVVAEVPMAEIRHYATELRSMTGGRGTFVAEFVRYDPMPEHEMQKVVEKIRVEAEAAT